MELVKLLPLHWFSVDNFHILVLWEYWVLKESRIRLKPVLGGVRIVALSAKPSLLFSNIVGSVYCWRIHFFQIILIFRTSFVTYNHLFDFSDQPNRSTFPCPYCGLPNLTCTGLVDHCNEVHKENSASVVGILKLAPSFCFDDNTYTPPQSKRTRPPF